MAIENLGILVISKGAKKQKSKRMLWESGWGAGQAWSKPWKTLPGAPTHHPRKGQGILFSLAQFHLVLPFSTYAKTADSLDELYQIQMVKNNLLNTFLDKLKSKPFLNLVQLSLKG